MENTQPKRIGHYILEQQIGQGGMASVYRGQHPTLQRNVAIKLMHQHLTYDPDARARFLREARAVAGLRHPHIVTVYDFGEDQTRQYIVMELFSGGSLRDLLRAEARLHPYYALTITAQLADALGHAHRHGLIHRDVKPANVLFTTTAHDQAVLTDFGIVRVWGDGHHTAEGAVIGTPAYMSPEVILGKPPENASDLYALGIMLFEMLTGDVPYRGASPMATMFAHVKEPLPDLAALNLPDEIAHLLARLLAKEPAQRPPSGSDVATTIRRLIGREGTTTLPLHLAQDMPTLVVSDDFTPTQSRYLVGNLPVTFGQGRQFFGREDARAQLAGLLRAHERVIVVQGKAGIGKSALVSKVLGDTLLAADAIAGVVALSTATQPNEAERLNLDRIIRSFQRLLPHATIPHNPEAPIEQQVSHLLDMTRQHHLVLLLDNLETLQHEDHSVTDAGIAALLAAVLAQGGLTILITSQLPVRLTARGQTPHIKTIPLDHGLPPNDALALLHQAWGDEPLPPTDDLMRLISETDGHPRALEAAADWLLQNPIASIDDLLVEIAQQQGEIVAYLVGKAIDNLPPDLQMVLSGIAIFTERAAVDALEYVLSPFVGGSIREALNRLVLRRFAQFDRPTRTLTLHSLDRAYCLAKLPTDRTDEHAYSRFALLNRVASYYAAQRKPKDDWNQFEDVSPQLAEYDYRVALGDYVSAAKLAMSIGHSYLIPWGHATLLLTLLQRVVDHLTDAGQRADVLQLIATTHRYLGDLQAARQVYDQALSLIEASGDRRSLCVCRVNLGIVLRILGDPHAALQNYQISLPIAQELGDQRIEGAIHSNVGIVYTELGDIAAAIEHINYALSLSRQIGDTRGESNRLGNLASAYVVLGDITRARDYLNTALDISRTIGDRFHETYHLGNLATCYLLLDDLDAALVSGLAALDISREIGDQSSEAEDLITLAAITIQHANFSEALAYLRQAEALAAQIQAPFIDVNLALVQARFHLAQGDESAALAVLAAHLDDAPHEFSHIVASVGGVAAWLSADRDLTVQVFTAARRLAQDLLDKSPQHYTACYALGLSQAGMALLAANGHMVPAAPAGGWRMAAESTYRLARHYCDAAGVLRDQRRWLDLLIDTSNGEILRPVRALLND